MFTLTLNNKVLASDLASRDDAEKLAEKTANQLMKSPGNKAKFPWGFAFRIKKNNPIKTYAVKRSDGRIVNVTIPD